MKIGSLQVDVNIGRHLQVDFTVQVQQTYSVLFDEGYFSIEVHVRRYVVHILVQVLTQNTNRGLMDLIFIAAYIPFRRF
jgi:hypothetical protein